jgi:uncharacterized membrane protein
VRIGVEIVYLIERRYSKRLALISLLGHLIAAICTIIIFVSPRIVYWEYIVWVDALFASVDAATWFETLLRNPHLVVLFILSLIYIIESITVIIRGNKAQKGTDKEKADEADVVKDSFVKDDISEENNTKDDVVKVKITKENANEVSS